MAQERLQVSSGLQPDPLRPVAAPVDTYNPNAGRAASAGLAGLAQGLAQIAPEMQRFAGQEMEKFNQKKSDEGIALATQLSANGKSYADAVKEGLIPQNANPFFMAGFHEQMGRVVGDREHADLEKARAEDDDLQNSTDQSDYEKFDAKHHADWMAANVPGKDQNRYFTKGYDSRLAAYAHEDSQRIAGEIAGRISTQANEAQFDETMTHIQLSVKNGLAPEQIAADINSLNDSLIAQGRSGRSVAMTAVKAITEAAKSDPTNGMHILEALKSVNGKFGSLANTTYGSAAYVATRDYVGSEQMRVNREQEQQAREEKRAKTADIYSRMTAALAQDKHSDISAFQGELAKVDPVAAAKLPAMVRRYNSGTVTTDQKVQTSVITGIFDGSGDTTVESILTHAGNGDLTWQDAQSDILRLQKFTHGHSGKSIYDSTDFIRAQAQLKSRFTTEMSVFNPTVSDNAAHANGDFQADFADWKETEEGQKAGYRETSAWFQHEEDKLVAHYRKAYTTTPEPKMVPQKTVGTTTPVTTREVAQPDLLAFVRPLKPGGPPSLTITDAARAIAARHGAKSDAEIRAFLQKQINLTP